MNFLPRNKIKRLPKVRPKQAGTIRTVVKRTRTGRKRIKKVNLKRKVAPKPTYHARVHAILAGNDDGSCGASKSKAVDAAWLGSMFNKANAIYKSTGIQFAYNRGKDFERINSTLLNLDYIVPSGFDYDQPKSDPALSDKQLIKSSFWSSASRVLLCSLPLPGERLGSLIWDLIWFPAYSTRTLIQ